MKTVAAYIRVSTEDQLEFSPESQVKQIKDYAKHNNMILPEQYIFTDEGISGKDTKKRPAFNKMIGIAKLKPKPFEAILLWKFSRFARNRQDSIVYKSMLRKQLGIDVISISENLGDDKMSILFEAMIEAMDEYYSINLAEEVKRGMLEKASRGGVVSSPAFGYIVENKMLIPHPEQAIIVKKIFHDFLSGKSQREIALELNAMGIRNKRGYALEHRNITYILKNPVYIGKIRWNTNGKSQENQHKDTIKIFDGIHKPIIDDASWNKVQSKLLNLKSKHKKHQRETTSSYWALQGLVKCSNCGKTLSVTSQGNRVQCTGYSHGICNVSHSIAIHTLEDAVLKQISQDMRGINLTISRPCHSFVDQISFQMIDAQIQKEEKKRKRIQIAYQTGIDTLDEYNKNKAEIDKHIKALKAKYQSMHNQALREPTDYCDPNSNQPQEKTLSSQEKNLILNNFIEKIVFNRTSTSVDIFYRI